MPVLWLATVLATLCTDCKYGVPESSMNLLYFYRQWHRFLCLPPFEFPSIYHHTLPGFDYKNRALNGKSSIKQSTQWEVWWYIRGLLMTINGLCNKRSCVEIIYIYIYIYIYKSIILHIYLYILILEILLSPLFWPITSKLHVQKHLFSRQVIL